LKNFNKNKFSIVIIIITGFCFSFGVAYQLDLKTLSPEIFERLESYLQIPLKSIPAVIHEYKDLRDFTKSTKAPYWIKGFTNSSGIYLQSRYLIGNDFENTLLHELIHWTMQINSNLPGWFEEGIVGILTGEFENVKGIEPMKEVDTFLISKAQNPWELTSYCLGCIEAVKKILGLSEGGK